jgi:hypothetical protein
MPRGERGEKRCLQQVRKGFGFVFFRIQYGGHLSHRSAIVRPICHTLFDVSLDKVDQNLQEDV